MSAILLRKAGMSREYIIADFMKTAFNLEAYLAQFASERPGIRLDVITPHERYMEELLARSRHRRYKAHRQQRVACLRRWLRV